MSFTSHWRQLLWCAGNSIWRSGFGSHLRWSHMRFLHRSRVVDLSRVDASIGSFLACGNSQSVPSCRAASASPQGLLYAADACALIDRRGPLRSPAAEKRSTIVGWKPLRTTPRAAPHLHQATSLRAMTQPAALVLEEVSRYSLARQAGESITPMVRAPRKRRVCRRLLACRVCPDGLAATSVRQSSVRQLLDVKLYTVGK